MIDRESFKAARWHIEARLRAPSALAGAYVAVGAGAGGDADFSLWLRLYAKVLFHFQQYDAAFTLLAMLGTAPSYVSRCGARLQAHRDEYAAIVPTYLEARQDSHPRTGETATEPAGIMPPGGSRRLTKEGETLCQPESI